MDDGINLSMPVAPAYTGGYGMNNGGFGSGFGGDGWWVLLLLLAFGGGWGNGLRAAWTISWARASMSWSISGPRGAAPAVKRPRSW